MPDTTPVVSGSSRAENNAALQMLPEISLMLCAFRNRLREAGYPFREPPNVEQMLARIDALVFPPKEQPKKNNVAAHYEIPVFPMM